MHGCLSKSPVQWLSILTAVFFAFPTLVHAGSVRGKMDFQGETLHFEFEGQNTWDYQVNKKFDAKNKMYFEMSVPALTAQSLQEYLKAKNALISKIELAKDAPAGKTVLHIYPVSESVDFFDYLTDQPSKLVVDFYMGDEAGAGGKSGKKSKKTAAVDVSPVDGNVTAIPLKNSKKGTKRPVAQTKSKSRTPATADVLAISQFGSIAAAPHAGIFDGSDPFYERFNVKDYEVSEDAVIRSRNNYYISFPQMNVTTNFWEQVKSQQDSYQIEPQDTKENKDARLLSRIFDRKDNFLFLKTYGYFEKSFPESKYFESLAFMKGDVLMRMWQDDTYRQATGDKKEPKPSPDRWYREALDAYKAALMKYPNSPLAERLSLKIGILQFEKKDYFDALRTFNEHINNKNYGEAKTSLSKNIARMGQGMAFMNIGKYQDATNVFNELEAQSGLENIRAEAGYRKGDVLYKEHKYAEALLEYQKALKTYPKFENDFPQAVYHQGEAQFWLGNYRDSLNAYREFIRKFPTHSETPFATTRVGELLDILGADPTRVMGAYLETYFRFGDSPKTIIARIHMTSQQMKGLKPKDADAAATQILELSQKLDLPKIDQFATVMISDGYSRRKDYQKAVDLLVKFYQEHPTSIDKDIFERRIVANINDKLEQEVNSGQFINALRTHQRYGDSWFKKSPRLDTAFNVGRAFEQAGVSKEAAKSYKEVLNQLYSLAGTAKAKEESVLEKLPSDQEVLLRLAAATYQGRDFNQSLDFVRQIKNPEKLTEDEQIERIDIISQLLEKKGDEETAILHLNELIKTWKGEPGKVASPYLRLAEAEYKLGRVDDAVQSLQRIDEIQKDSNGVRADIHSAALKMKADIFLKADKRSESIAAIESLLKSYGKNPFFASYKYRLGDLYFKNGDLNKAKNAWGDLDGTKDKFWADLAQEQMSSQKWNDEYKRYLQRIPAAVGSIR